MIKLYRLVNEYGCVMATARTTTFRKARKIFALIHEGNYRISDGEDFINVKL